MRKSKSSGITIIMAAFILSGCITTKQNTPLLSEGKEQFFALMIADQVMGYNTYKVIGKKQYLGDTVYHIESHTFMKIKLTSGEIIMDYKATTYLYEDLTPAYYKLNFTQGEQEQNIEINSIRDKLFPEKKNSTAFYIADGNIFDHYVFLLSALGLKKGENKEVSLFIPQVNKDNTLNSKFSVSDTLKDIELSGKQYDVLEVEADIAGLYTSKFFVSGEGKLISMSLPSQDFCMELSDSGIISRIKGIAMMTLLESKFCDSNVSFSFMTNVNYMKAEIEVTVAGEKVLPGSLNLEGQSFRGSVEDNLIKGIVENRVKKYNGENVYMLPAKFDSTFTDWLSPAHKIESDDPLIIDKARIITEGSKNAWDAVNSLTDWVYRNIRYEITGTGAKQALIDLKGDCGPQAYLAIALARALGIPSRLAGGFVYNNGRFGQHYWVENYMGDAGWIPSDPTLGECGWIDATHVRLFQEAAQEAAIESLISVIVIDYEDAGLQASKQERIESLLQVGRKGIYIFMLDGKEFGRNEYEVTEKEDLNGSTVYTCKSSLNLDFSKIGMPKKLNTDAELRIDQFLFPVSYTVNALVNEQKQTINCIIKEGTAEDIITVEDKVHKKDIKLEDNTILLDNNMIGWCDLMYSTLALKKGETFHIPVFFPANFLKMTLTINVRDETSEITAGGRSYSVFVCDVPALKEIDYVTEDGILVKIEIPAQKVEIIRQ